MLSEYIRQVNASVSFCISLEILHLKLSMNDLSDVHGPGRNHKLVYFELELSQKFFIALNHTFLIFDSLHYVFLRLYQNSLVLLNLLSLELGYLSVTQF